MRGGGIPGRTKVNQLHMSLAVLTLCQENIIRRNIPVDDAVAMDILQCLQNRNNYIHSLLLRYFFLSFHEGCQGLTLQVLHDDICRVVGLKAVIDMYDPIKTTQRCQLFGFIQEFVHSGSKLLHLLFTAVDHHLGLMKRPCGEFTGQVLFDGYFTLQLAVISDIRHAKAAETQGVSYQVPVRKHGACINMQQFLPFAVFLISAIGAYIKPLVIKLHAAHALFFRTHSYPPSLERVSAAVRYYLRKLLSDVVISIQRRSVHRQTGVSAL